MLPAKPTAVALRIGVSLAAVFACTWVAYSLRLNLASAGFLFLVLVVLSALHAGLVVSTLTSIAAVTCLTYFFVPPVFTFTVNHPENWVALGAFEFTALTISRLSHRARARAAEAVAERSDNQRLYQAAQRILALDRSPEPGTPIPPILCDVFALSGALLLDASSARTHRFGTLSDTAEAQARRTYESGADTFDQSSATWLCVLRLGGHPVGALALAGGELRPLVATAIASLAAVALERSHAFDRQCEAEAARRSEQLRTAVLEALAHQFKTPLTVIRTVSSGLLAAGGLAPGDAELVGLIDEQSRKLNDLASRLLSAGNVDAVQFQPQCETVLISDLVSAALGATCPGESRGRVVLSTPREETPVRADPKLMTTALAQLVDNALKYSAPASPIGIAVAVGNREVTVTVESRGDPISPADCGRVFDRFYRAAGAPDRPPGTGLGLAIVKRIVDAHQGHVWAESDPGGQSVFTIALPSLASQAL